VAFILRHVVSFFDEVEEPAFSRPATGRARRTRAARRSRAAQRKFLVRRAVLAVGVLVAILLVVLGVHSCQVSARNSAMRDYDNSVASLIARSNQTGRALFSELSGASGSSNQASLQTQVDQTTQQAVAQLNQAQRFSVPDQMKGAQSQLVLALKMRSDAVSRIAHELQPALATPTSRDAVASISGQMSRLYASDVLYNDYVAPAIAASLRSVGIPVGGLEGQPITHGNFVPNPQWLSTGYIAAKLGTTTTKSGATPAPGIHGHRMESVTVNGVALKIGTTNSVAASPPPTFVCTFANDGQNAETNVIVKVTVQGTSVSGQAVVPRTVPGQTYTAHVTLSSTPPAGTHTLVATIERVPGETITTHNTLSFPVTFR
jgi:hypothetical protein